MLNINKPYIESRVNDWIKRVDKLYSLVKDVKNGVKRVFNSLEIDILPNGDLPITEAGMDYLWRAIISQERPTGGVIQRSSFTSGMKSLKTRICQGLICEEPENRRPNHQPIAPMKFT